MPGKLNQEQAEFKVSYRQSTTHLISKYVDWKSPVIIHCDECRTDTTYCNLTALLNKPGNICPICHEREKQQAFLDQFVGFARGLNVEPIGELPKNKTSPGYFRCLEESCKNEFSLTFVSLLKGCAKCKDKNRRTPNDVFVERLKNKKPDITPLDKYVRCDAPIRFRCSCGDLIIATPHEILRTKYAGCSSCSDIQRGLDSRLTLEECQERLSARHPNVIITKFTKANEPMSFACTDCPRTWTTKNGWQSVLNSKHGCKSCAGKKMHEDFKAKGINPSASIILTNDEVNARLQEHSPNVRLISDHTSCTLPITFECDDCGGIRTAHLSQVLP